MITPNPMDSSTKINIPESSDNDFIFNLSDARGQKLFPDYRIEQDQIILSRGNLPQGTYFVWLRTKKGISRTGKIIITGN
jgi:hypothetical protein